MDNINDGELIIIGETLEELDEDNLPRKKPVTIEDQYALDAQGRRRFHGAFTGGFSAGYFNSVDTRDGWKPNQFKSSRSDKAESVCQRPEDFMDDEDTGEFGIASTGIRASIEFANYTTRGDKRGRAENDNSGPIPGTPVLKDLLETVRDTVGVRLLKRMGWKLGQGIGPRLTSAEKGKLRQKQTNKKIYGCSLPVRPVESTDWQSEVTIEDLEVDGEISFAPDDLEPFQCKPKNNYFGIGYHGLNKMSMLSGEPKHTHGRIFRMQDRNKKLSIRGQAFGVGAFEADDDDIYELDDMTCYDFALQPEQRKNNRWSDERNCEPQRCGCLQGFVLADRPFEKKTLASPPNISGSFKPIHVIRRSRFSAVIDQADILTRSNRDSRYISHRNDIRMLERSPADFKEPVYSYRIPESLIEREKKSGRLPHRSMSSQRVCAMEQQLVENCSSAEDREVAPTPSWMDKLTTKSFVRGDTESTNKKPDSVDLTNGRHDFDTSIGDHSVGLSGYFERSTQSPRKEEVKLDRLDSVSREELEECEAEESTQNTDSIGQTTYLPNADTKINFGNTKFTPISEDFAINVAKMKMYGKITRVIDVWRPVNAVCKRFNIAEPQVGCAQSSKGKIKNHRLFESVDFCSGIITNPEDSQEAVDTNSSDSQSNTYLMSRNLKFLSAHDPIALFDPPKIISANFDGDNSTSVADAGQYAGDVCSDGQTITKKICHDERTDSKPSKSWPSLIQQNNRAEAKHDLFREIFLSCSEPSESGNESTDDIHSITVESLLIGKPANELNTQRNTSPARGIFAQLNVDQATGPVSINESRPQHLSYQDTNTSYIKSRTTENSNSGDIVDDPGCSSDVYGPALPTKFRGTIVHSRLDTRQSNKLVNEISMISKYSLPQTISAWVEKSKAKKSRKTKKKQKRKSRSKDRKHKYKSGKKNAN